MNIWPHKSDNAWVWHKKCENSVRDRIFSTKNGSDSMYVPWDSTEALHFCCAGSGTIGDRVHVDDLVHREEGPVFTAGFMPMIQIIAAVLDVFNLHE
jgi:ethanolamine utilization protein EutQ (cupin superfamily)